MSNTAFRNAIRRAVCADQITFRENGTTVFKRSYFYRHGQSAESFAEQVRQQVALAGFVPCHVQAEDKWAAWPRVSYFVVTMRVGMWA